MPTHEVVAKGEWVEARKRLLAKEKKFTRMREQLSAQRRALPWTRISLAKLQTFARRPRRGRAASCDGVGEAAGSL